MTDAQKRALWAAEPALTDLSDQIAEAFLKGWVARHAQLQREFDEAVDATVLRLRLQNRWPESTMSPNQ